VQIKKEFEKNVLEWETVFSNFGQLRQIIENHYPKFEHLINYLDNEDFLKADLTVKSSTHNISKDVNAFLE
jgi:hypothetical protein